MSKILKRCALVLLIGAAVAWYAWFLFFSGSLCKTHAQNSRNRAAMLQIRKHLTIGSSTGEVAQVFALYRTPELILIVDSNQRAGMEAVDKLREWASQISAGAHRRRPHPKDGPVDIP